MRLRLLVCLLSAAAVAAASMESHQHSLDRRAIPNAPQGATLKKDEIEGSGDPPKAGTVDTDTRKSQGYSPDDEDAVEGSGGGAPPAPEKPAAGSGPAAPAPTAAPAQPPKKPQAPAPPPPPSDSDDESFEGSGSDKDADTVFTVQPPQLTTTTTTTVAPAVVPGSGSAQPPKTMWETVAVTETPVLTTRGPIYEPPPRTTTSTPSGGARATERTPSRPNTTEQPALFPFHAMLKPGIFAAVVGGTVVGLLVAILLVMFIVYRMRKRDEGSYALEEPKQRPYAGYAYTKASSNKEFYA